MIVKPGGWGGGESGIGILGSPGKTTKVVLG